MLVYTSHAYRKNVFRISTRKVEELYLKLDELGAVLHHLSLRFPGESILKCNNFYMNNL